MAAIKVATITLVGPFQDIVEQPDAHTEDSSRNQIRALHICDNFKMMAPNWPPLGLKKIQLGSSFYFIRDEATVVPAPSKSNEESLKEFAHPRVEVVIHQIADGIGHV